MNSSRNSLLPYIVGGAATALTLGALFGILTRVKASPETAPSGIPFDQIDTLFKCQLKQLHVPGAVLAIVEGDRIVHQCSYGQAQPGADAPTPQTPFILGSTTKSFTALAVMQLVEAGRVELDAPIQTYLPWFRVADPVASTQITVRHLLNQTSGLPTSVGWSNLPNYDQRPDAAERQARTLAALKLKRPVGSKHEYSNMNYTILGLIIETASGESYESYIKNHIFIPLDMRHSYTAKAEAQQDGLARGHRYWFGIPVPAIDRPSPRGSLAAGFLISCAEDMAHYLSAYLNGGRYGDAHILSPAGIAELHRPAAPVEFMGASMGHYAMGWYNEQNNKTRFLWHSGLVPDFYTYMALLPEQNRGLVLLINADHFMMQPTMTEVGTALATLLAGEQPAPLKLGVMFRSMPALVLIPLFQIVGFSAALRRMKGWRLDPASRPNSERLWVRHILLPLLPNLALAGVPVYLFKSGLLGFLQLFFPDGALIGLNSGFFAGAWACLRTILMLRFLRKP